MVENFIVIQVTLAEIFVPQDFTIRTTPGLSGPADAYDGGTEACHKISWLKDPV